MVLTLGVTTNVGLEDVSPPGLSEYVAPLKLCVLLATRVALDPEHMV